MQQIRRVRHSAGVAGGPAKQQTITSEPWEKERDNDGTRMGILHLEI